MVEELDMHYEGSPANRKLRETIESLITRRSVAIRYQGDVVDYDITMNAQGKILLPGMPGYFSSIDIEKIGQALLEVAEEAQTKFKTTRSDQHEKY